MKKKLLIFVVTYKASFRILNLINKIPFKELSKYNYQIYISDDNSDDNISLKYLELTKNKFGSKIKLNFNKKNIGYGANIKKCIKYAMKNNYDYAAMLHGDNQYNPKYLANMIKLIDSQENFDAIVGSRLMNKKSALRGNMPIYKYIGNIFLSGYFNLFYNTQFTDCHTGYWMYKCSVIKNLYLKCDNNFCFDLDLRLQLVQKQKKIKEIAIKTFYGSERSSMQIIYAIRFFFKVLKFKFLNKL
jgi:GT2 family glycosyltransferase